MASDINEQLREELSAEFEYPFEVMYDPSLFVSQTKFSSLQESDVFGGRSQSTLSGEPRISAIYVPDSFVRMLEDRSRLEATKTETWNFYRKQANGAFPEEVLDFVSDQGLQRFTIDDAPEYSHLPEQIDWEYALGESERYDLLKQTLSEELVFLASRSKLLSRIPDTIDTLRDGGLPTVDIGRAQMQAEFEDRLETIGHQDIAKYCAIATSNSAPLIEPMFGTVLATTVDILAYQFDP